MGEKIKVDSSTWDGVLYPCKNRKDKIIIVIGGSDGGLEHTEKAARFLQDQGIPSLAYGLFKTKHTEKSLSMIPVDRVKTAINWLCSQGYEKIGIEGVSKGAEYALAAAINYPEDISLLILRTPSWFYSEGLVNNQPSGTSCWSYKGKEIPYTPYKKRKYNVLKMMWQAKEFNVLPMNLDKDVTTESMIPIEQVHAPILMMSIKADTIWPSTESCEIMCKRLADKNFAYPYRHVAYEYMSHMMIEYCGKQIKYFIKSEKEHPVEAYHERDLMGAETVDWIENIW